MTDQHNHLVLIVEDEPAVAASLAEAVARTPGLGCAGIATTLDQAEMKIYALKPRIVLIDIGLPDGSGLDAVRACAQADWDVSTIIVSIYDEEAKIVEAITAGAAGYIFKGDDHTQIGKDILSVLKDGYPISPSIAKYILRHYKTQSASGTSADIDLTLREKEVLRLVCIGCKRQEIAKQLNISAATVGKHITSAYEKMNVKSNTEATLKASQYGIL